MSTTSSPKPQVQPKSSCRHCHGRGYTGTDTATGKKVLCRCVKRNFKQAERLQKQADTVVKPTPVQSDAGWETPAYDMTPTSTKPSLGPSV